MLLLFELILIILTLFYAALSTWLIFGLRKLSKKSATTIQDSQPNVSIIIAARNEEKNIGECLQNCASQNYPIDKFEVVVVNDRSDDNTQSIIENIVKDFKNVRMINITELPAEYTMSGKKHALKKGIENSTGDIIMLTDADCFPNSNWIRGMVQYFQEDVGVLVGHSPLDGTGFINRLQQLDNLSIIAVGAGGIGGGYPILSVGRNFAYRRCVYNEINGFEEIKNFSSGDDDLFLMLVREKTKWKINFASDSDSFVYTYPAKSFNQASKQRMRWASKGLHYTIPMTLSLIMVFFYNLFLFIAVPVFVLKIININMILYSFFIKIISDFIIMYKAGKLLNESYLIKYFPIAALLHIPYLIFFGLYGTFGKVQWKSQI